MKHLKMTTFVCGPADKAEGGGRLVLDKDDSIEPYNTMLSPVVKRLLLYAVGTQSE